MILARYRSNFLGLLLLMWGTSSCLASPRITSTTELPNHTPEWATSVEIVFVTPTPPGVTPTPSTPLTMTALIAPTNLQLTQITPAFTAGAFWAKNGQALVYATREQPEQGWTWWEYEIDTGEQRSITAPFQIEPQLWEQWDFYERAESYIWGAGGFSPSGAYILYTRLSSDYASTPTLDDFSLPRYEAWIVRTDGSQAVKVQSHCRVIQALWLNQETQVIFTCSTEGGWEEIWLANVDGSNTFSLSSGVFGGQYNNDWLALSPDETKLAFVDNLFRVRVAALDGSENIEVKAPCELTFRPNWSADSQRVYFKCQGFSEQDQGIYVYDLRTGISTLFIALPLVLDDGRAVNLAEMNISPCETNAVFVSRGLWLITWIP